MDVGPGTIVGDKYRLERPLSRGGMGSVWGASHIQLGAPVAIKFMDPEHAASPELRARFYREARTAANLGSPHVVSVQDYGIQGAIPYLVMELLRGEDLGRRLKRLRRIPLADAARVAVQAGKALRRAHEAGLVHRDLKPGNLFLARVDDEELVKVLDFGIAKQVEGKLDDETTKTGELLGSPFYMSPEQARGDKDLDARSDLWSLGVILFRAVTGKLPFDGDVLGAVLSRILVDPIPRCTEIVPELPAELDGFFLRALARDRAQRFQSAQEMARAFVIAAGDVGVPLPVPSLPQPEPEAKASRTGTLLGLSPAAAAELARPIELDALSFTGEAQPRQDEDPRGILATPAEPSQPGTLSAATAGVREGARGPHARKATRWVLVCGALFVISGAATLAAIRRASDERPGAAAAPIDRTSVEAAPPVEAHRAASTGHAPTAGAPVASNDLRAAGAPVASNDLRAAGAPVASNDPRAAGAPVASSDQHAAAAPSGTADAAGSRKPAAPRRSAPRRGTRAPRDIVDPWGRR